MQAVHADSPCRLRIRPGCWKEARRDAARNPRATSIADEARRGARECGLRLAERGALMFAFCSTPTSPSPTPGRACRKRPRSREASRRARTDAEALAARLVLTAQDLDDATAKAKAWLEEWNKGKGKKT